MTEQLPRNSKRSPRRIALAFAVAAIADALQFPLTAGMIFGATVPPLLLADVVIDLIAMVITVWLLGFHWVLLPGFILEAIPGIDLIPTWTGCVAFVVWRQKQAAEQSSPVASPTPAPDRKPPVIDV